MTLIIDIRPLQNAPVAGVVVYIEGLLKLFFEVEKRHETGDVILWTNAKGEVRLPDFIERYLQLPNVMRVHTTIPNRFLNLCMSFFRCPKLDKWILSKAGKPKYRGGVDFWVMDPSPTPVSKNTRKHMIVHDLSLLKFPEFFSPKSNMWGKVVRFSKEFKEAHKLYAVSHFTKSEIIAFDARFEDKTEVLTPNIILPVIEPTEDVKKRLMAKYGLSGSFLYGISTLEPRKNFEEVIERFQNGEFPEYDQLIIAGKRDPKVFGEVDLSKADGDGRIQLLGYVSNEDKWALYELAKGYVSLSKYEGYGIPVKEAMCFNLPLVLSDIPIYREVVGDYPNVTWVK